MADADDAPEDALDTPDDAAAADTPEPEVDAAALDESADELATEPEPTPEPEAESNPLADAESDPLAEADAESDPLADADAESDPLAEADAESDPLADADADDTLGTDAEDDLTDPMFAQPTADSLDEAAEEQDSELDIDPSMVQGTPMPEGGDADYDDPMFRVVAPPVMDLGPGAVLFGTALSIEVAGRSLERIQETLPNVDWTDDPGAGPFSIVVVSTRVDAGVVGRQIKAYASQGIPVVLVVHPGGEGAAPTLLAAGATTAVAEGNEANIGMLVADAAIGGGLVEAFHTHTAATSTRAQALITDPGTGLGGLVAFDAALTEAGGSPIAPRILVITAQELANALDQINDGLASVLRRRIAQGWATILKNHHAILYALDATHFATMIPNCSDEELDELIDELQESTTVFAPTRGRRLEIAIGYAGPEDHPDINAIRDLAERACDSAMTLKRRGVSANDLVDAVAERTELLTLLEAVRELEREHPHLAGRSERITDIAIAIGEQLSMTTSDLNRLRVAARFCDVGLVGYEAEDLPRPDGTEPDTDAYREHPLRGEKMLVPTAGSMIATAVRHSHALMDDTGLTILDPGEELPLMSRILVVANKFELAVSAEGAPETAIDDVMQLLEDDTKYDEAVVAGLASVAGRLRMGRLARAG